jgi:RNA polymerase sigma factor (sigma-70 family)
VIGRTRRGRAADALARADAGAGADERCPEEGTRDAPQLRVVSGEFYPDWEAVYRDNVDRVYGLMYAKVGNRPDAEDLTAEVFLAALRPLRVSASAPEVRAYLLTTARTVLAGYWRRTLGREITRLSDDDELEWVPAQSPVAPEAATRAAVILAELPELYRRILQLRFLEACSVREAAAALGVSVTYAKVLQHRALRRAAQRLEVDR